MLATTVVLHDVEDVEGFVHATLNDIARKADVTIRGEERDELVLEGLTLMYELAGKYAPQEGHARQDSRFSGFAAYFLPKKLATAWHRLHENHRYTTRPDGKREWLYLKPAISFDGLCDQPGGGTTEGSRRDLVEGHVLAPSKWAPVEAS